MSSRDMRESNSSKTYSLVMQHQVKASGILFKEQRISTSNLSQSLVIFKVLWVFSVSSYEVVRSPVVDQYSSNYCRQLVRQLPLHSSHKIGETLGKASESTLLKWRQGIGNDILGPSNRTPFSSHLEPETPKRRRNRQKLEYEYNSVQYGVCCNRSFWGARRLMVLKVSSEDLSHRVSTTIFQRSRPETVDCGLRVTEVLWIFVTRRFSALVKGTVHQQTLLHLFRFGPVQLNTYMNILPSFLMLSNCSFCYGRETHKRAKGTLQACCSKTCSN